MSNFQPEYKDNVASIMPQNIFASDIPAKRLAITVLSGQGVLKAGTVLGKVTLGAVSVNTIATKGALTPDATTPRLAGCQVGAYKVRCIQAIADSGEFEVTDPKGNSLGTVLVGATFANQIKFAIADVAVDFAAGDTFTVTVAEGSGKYVKSLSTALDGSQDPKVILAEDIDATSADVVTVSYETGDFVDSFLILGTDHTIASIRDGLRARGIFISAEAKDKE